MVKNLFDDFYDIFSYAEHISLQKLLCPPDPLPRPIVGKGGSARSQGQLYQFFLLFIGVHCLKFRMFLRHLYIIILH